MSKHDTWVKFKPGHPFEDIEDLFPDGFPMRDPFAMAISDEGNQPLWIMDMDRLSSLQKDAIAFKLAKRYGINPQQAIDESSSGFAIAHKYIQHMWGGAENYRRTIEMIDFNEKNSVLNFQPWENFCEQQRRDWIDGDKVPEPMPENYQDIDPRLKSPELEEAYKKIQVNKILTQGNYSVLDVLTGKATIDVLNQIDPESDWSPYTDEDYEDYE